MSKYEEYYDDFVRSGMSARAFATSRGLSRNGFYLFLRSKRNHEAKGQAVTIIAPEDDSVESFLVRIERKGITATVTLHGKNAMTAFLEALRDVQA